MKDWVTSLHVVSGVVVFATGILQIILKKGGKLHRSIGWLYFAAWLVILVTGAVIGSPLITLIGVFGFYFVLTGTRLAASRGKTGTLADKIIYTGVLFLAASMVGVTLYLITKGDKFYIPMAVFTGLICWFGYKDFYKYALNRPIKPSKYGAKDWYIEHFTRMYASLIASVTAFASIQNIFGIGWVNFLLPTVIGFFFIRYSVQKQTKKG